MRKLFSTAAAAGLLMTVAVATSANATTSFTETYGIPVIQASDPGLVLRTADIQGGSFSFDLDVGQHKTSDLFKIYTTETSLQGDDTALGQQIEVTFDFSTPTPNSGVSVDGSTGGFFSFYGFVQNGFVTWTQDGTLDFGNGGVLDVHLNNGVFDSGVFGLRPGEKGGATITADFSLVHESAVPEPASWALVIGGFGMAGTMLRRRRAVAAAA